MMNRGPQKTGSFKGFGFGLNTAGRAGAPTSVKPFGGSKAAAGKPKSAVSTLFNQSLDDEQESGKATGLPSFGRLSIEAKQQQRMAEEIQAADPSVFQYDEVIESVKEESGLDSGSQAVRTNTTEQKKRTGLTVMSGSEEVRAGNRRSAKYVEKVIVATDRRRVEQQIAEDKLLAKDKDRHKDAEVFVTSGFKAELQKRKKFEEELEKQDKLDAARAAERMQGGKGFADMYRNLLNGGLASSRGGEKLKEQAPAFEGDIIGAAPRSAAAAMLLEEKRLAQANEQAKSEVKDEVKEEDEEQAQVKMQTKEEAVQDEPTKDHGVQDVAAPPEEEGPEAKRARVEVEKEQRQEKAMSAKERYLARKKAAEAEKAANG